MLFVLALVSMNLMPTESAYDWAMSLGTIHLPDRSHLFPTKIISTSEGAYYKQQWSKCCEYIMIDIKKLMFVTVIMLSLQIVLCSGYQSLQKNHDYNYSSIIGMWYIVHYVSISTYQYTRAWHNKVFKQFIWCIIPSWLPMLVAKGTLCIRHKTLGRQ